jgi:GT2 family glycosyltransferase
MFGSFGEEIDLEWRLKIANYKLIQLNTLLCHYSGGSFSKYPVTAAYLMMRNTLRLNIKYYKFRKLHADSKMILYRIKQGRTDQSAKDGYFYTNCLIPKGKMYSLLLFVCAVIWNIMFLPVTIFSGVIAIKRAKIAAKIDI